MVLLFAALVAALLPMTVTPRPGFTAAAAKSADPVSQERPHQVRAAQSAATQSATKSAEELRSMAKSAKGPSVPEKFEELPPQPSRGQKLRDTRWIPLPDSMQLPRPEDAFPSSAPNAPPPGSEVAKDKHAPPLLQVFLH